MSYFANAFNAAIELITSFDAELYEIVFNSVSISFIAAIIAGAIAIPAGIFMALNQFHGKQLIQHVLNTLMAMPTVLIGLLLYGFLSRQSHFNLPHHDEFSHRSRHSCRSKISPDID